MSDTAYVATDYAGDILGESVFASKLWNKMYEMYTPEFIKEYEITVMSRREYLRRFASV